MKRLPSLDALRALECAARHLSFTKAAEELHVTQSALSHRISALEREGIAVGIAEVELGGFEGIDHALLLEELVPGHGAAGE